MNRLIVAIFSYESLESERTWDLACSSMLFMSPIWIAGYRIFMVVLYGIAYYLILSRSEILNNCELISFYGDPTMRDRFCRKQRRSD
jgi:hypothetical protein